MSRYVVVSDFDLTGVGKRFDLEEIRDNVDRETGEIIGHYYDVKALDGPLRKKLLTVRVDGYSRDITNEDIIKCEQFIVAFDNLRVSSIQPRRLEGLRVYYIADSIKVLEKVEM